MKTDPGNCGTPRSSTVTSYFTQFDPRELSKATVDATGWWRSIVLTSSSNARSTDSLNSDGLSNLMSITNLLSFTLKVVTVATIVSSSSGVWGGLVLGFLAKTIELTFLSVGREEAMNQFSPRGGRIENP